MARRGRQEPTFHVAEPYASTQGPLACKLACAYGLAPLPWQSAVLDDWLAVDADGRLVHDTCLLPVPRQNGKTGVSDPRETVGLIVRGEAILHTAQEFQTAKKAFDRLREKFGERKGDPYAKYPELNALVRNYTTSANMMILDLVNGGHIEFRTRGSNADMGRGGTFDLVVIDEAQSYTEAQDDALSPLNSAAPSGSPQTIFMGTVPVPGSGKGLPWWRQRETAHSKEHAGMCCSEWSTGEVGDPWDVDRWYAANPSLGYHLLEKGLRKDARSMTAAGFAREHLGLWPKLAPAKSEPVFGSADWQGTAADEMPRGTRSSLGVRFSADGNWVDVAEAVLAADGAAYMKVVVHAPVAGYGLNRLTERLVDRLRTSASMAAIDGRSYAGALSEMLGESKLPKDAWRLMTTSEAISACAMLASSVTDGTVRHVTTDPDSDEAMASSVRRPVGSGGGWGFGGEGADRVTAMAQALWALRMSKRDPKRRARIG